MNDTYKKLKYFLFSTISTVTLVPLTIWAVSVIPLTFKEGDVISASVMNSILGRINDVQTGFVNASELDGTWSCITTDMNNFVGGACNSTWPYSKTGAVNFDGSAKKFKDNSPGALESIFFCGDGYGAGRKQADYEVKSNYLWMHYTNGWDAKELLPISKISPDKFQLNFGGQAILECSRSNAMPAPVNNLAATVSGSDVNLAWVVQSTDENRFRIQRKSSVTGDWGEIGTSAPKATSFTDKGLLKGTYWYRVLASSANGDSMSSSEVQVVIQ